MIPAIILAAGASTRMGRCKALLPAGADGQPFVVTLARAMLGGGADDLVIVTAAERNDIRAVLDAEGIAARVLLNPEPERGQLSSLLIAINVIDQPGVRAALMTPVDLPRIAPATVRTVIDAYRRTRAPLVRPVRAGKHGHPVLLDRALFDELRRLPHGSGANVVVRAHAAAGIEVPTVDEGAFADIDTPEDYLRAFGVPLPPAS
jgi:CTP:molybdopterin cytidylyltransferase MocA